MESGLVELLLFVSIFLILTGWLHRLTARLSFLPYTVALLLAGFVAQYLTHQLAIPLHLELGSDLIYYLLLPLLLFESAFHINFHQFRLQFKTITFLATFGLLVSVFVVGCVLALLANYPLDIAILFGALISATDPIAVISIFKTLGAPKRLALVADGESMLNDATGVIAYKVVAGFVLAGTQLESQALLLSTSNFAYVFVGSLIFGALVGYIFSKLIEWIQNDLVIETTLTVAAALGSFVAAEHFFHFSGVISCVLTGIVIGNLGKTKFSPGIRRFAEEFWSYFAFVAVSLVFFFATFNLDLEVFTHKPLVILAAIAAVLIGRCVSVYLSCWLTNSLPFFKDEPNIPMSWQHILNWGGLRGVIPLVLVLSLPEDFAYRNDLLSFTMGAFLFTLFVNGLTIRTLLIKLGVHMPKREEAAIAEASAVVDIEKAIDSLDTLRNSDFDASMIVRFKNELLAAENKHIEKLAKLLTPDSIESCLRIQSLLIERDALENLFSQKYVSENVYFDFEAELDLQLDALEYPEVFAGRAMEPGGKIKTQDSITERALRLRSLSRSFPLFKFIFKSTRDTLLEDRISMLKVRIITSERVIEELQRFEKYLQQVLDQKILHKLIEEHHRLIKDNKEELLKLSSENPRVLRHYQEQLVQSVLDMGSARTH